MTNEQQSLETRLRQAIFRRLMATNGVRPNENSGATATIAASLARDYVLGRKAAHMAVGRLITGGSLIDRVV